VTAYFKWREQMVYEDSGRFLVFEAPMGVSPHNVYVPTTEIWRDKVPDWAADKRDDVLAAIRAVEGVGQVVEEPHAWVSTKPF